MATKVFELIDGAALRFTLFSTHYKRPIDFNAAKLNESKTVLTRWLNACEFSDATPPVEFLETFSDDMNVAKGIALMHKYRKEGEGKKLFACLRYLGFFKDDCFGIPEVKTLPED